MIPQDEIRSMLAEAQTRLLSAGIGCVLLKHSIAISKDNEEAAQAVLDECQLPAHISQYQSDQLTYIKATL